ncbi:uncharacterized protein A4U43_C04F3140 [Asparagus officinalis]|uniref:C2H2-type domain-containing protein n=1 Tax=Asparagus officinalis TaxID=4686 RepID=A0A5P1EXY6_ASPOF|nr:uncharacterized protein A4U43_C04F3140 [Asparagus officinalis]
MDNQSKNIQESIEEVAENDVKVYNCPHPHCTRTFYSSQALAGHCKSHRNIDDEIPDQQHRHQTVQEDWPPITLGQCFSHDPDVHYHHYHQPITSQPSNTNVPKLAYVPSQSGITFNEPFTHPTRITTNPNPNSTSRVYDNQPITNPNPIANSIPIPTYHQPITSQSSNSVRNHAYAPSQALTFYEPFTYSTRVTTNPNPSSMSRTYDLGSSSSGSKEKGKNVEENSEEELDLTLRLGR